MSMKSPDYIMTACAQEAVNSFWPRKPNGDSMLPTSTNAKEFMVAMRNLQAELISCHLPNMDAMTRARALWTLKWLGGEKCLFSMPQKPSQGGDGCA